MLFRLNALAVLCLSSSVIAAPAISLSTAYLKPNTQLGLCAYAPLYVSLSADESACKKAYGNRWRNHCYGAYHPNASRVTGVDISPKIEGSWQWSGGSTLVFQPSHAWAQNTLYHVSLNALKLPPRITLTQKDIRFKTAPLSATAKNARFWLDPKLQGERSLSFEITFSTIPDTRMIEKQFNISGLTPDMRLGAPTFLWSTDKTRCYIRIPVLTLPKKTTLLTLGIKGVAGRVEYQPATRHYQIPSGQENTLVQLSLPGTDSLFRIKNSSIKSVRDKTLEHEYVITLKTSLLVKPSELLAQLDASVLPDKLNPAALSPTDWRQVPNIDEEVLARAQKLTLKAQENPDIPTDTITLHTRSAPGHFICLALKKGFGPHPDLTLPNDWQQIFFTQKPNATLDFLQPGHLLTLAGARELSLFANGIQRIEWRIERIRDPYLSLVAQQYEPLSNITQTDQTTQALRGSIELNKNEPTKTQFASLDLKKILRDQTGLLNITLTGYATNAEGREEMVQETSRRVLISDIALIAKENQNQSMDIFLASLANGEALGGYNVEVLGANGIALFSTTTDKNGYARLPSTLGLEREKAPCVILARGARDSDNNELAWLPLNDTSIIDSVSNFTTQGRHTSSEGLNAFVFTERGIYRPGDTIHTGILVKQSDWSALTPNLPLSIRISDTTERTLLQKTIPVDPSGLSNLDWTIPPGTNGRLRIDVSTHNDAQNATLLGTSTVTVEEFAAETMKIKTRLNGNIPAGWITPDTLTAEIALQNLFGTAAAQRKIRAELSVNPAGHLSFKGFENYIFADAAPFSGNNTTVSLPETKTSDNGKAILNVALKEFSAATASCRLFVEGFEAHGGRAVSDTLNFLISPADTMLGWRIANTASTLDYVSQNQDLMLDLVLIDQNLKPQSDTTLSVTISHRQTITELTTDSQGHLRYDDTPIERAISQETLSTNMSGHATLTLNTQLPGDFLISLKKEDGTLLARIPYKVAGNDLRDLQNNTLPSSKLSIKTDKSHYEKGGMMRLSMLSPFKGFGLVTIEQDQVLSHQWIRVNAGENEMNISLPETALGRAYVYVSLVRDPSEAKRFFKGYAYAVAPISLNSADKDMNLSLTLPSRVTSAHDIPITISAKMPGKVFLWAVDEGILALSAYPTPSPLQYLLEDRALEVSTRQLLDTLMPEGILNAAQLPAFGGDLIAAARSMKMANPFKRTAEAPAVWWSGMMDVGNTPTTVKMSVPDTFAGTLRVIALGASDKGAGVKACPLQIQPPLVLTSQLPSTLSPGDTFEGAVSLTNNTGHRTNVSLRVTPGNNLKGDNSVEQISLENGEELTRLYRWQAGDALGPVSLQIKATHDAITTQRTPEITVRPATLSSLRVLAGRFNDDTSTQTLTLKDALYPHEADTTLTISSIALPIVGTLLSKLESPCYQTVSSSISQALSWSSALRHPNILAEMGLDIEYVQKNAARHSEQAQRQIQQAATWQGLSLWPNGASNDFLSAYAADFLLTLHETQQPVSSALLRDTIEKLERSTDRIPETLDQARTIAYALWVLTREGHMTGERIEALRPYLDERFSGWKNDLTALFIAGSYQIMRMRDDAAELMNTTIDFKRLEGGWWDPLTALSLATTVLAQNFPQKVDALSDGLTDELIQEVSSRSTPSISAALAARAMMSVATANTLALSHTTLACTQWAADFSQAVNTTKTPYSIKLSAPGCQQFQITGNDSLKALFWMTSAKGYVRNGSHTPISSGLEVSHEYLNDAGEPVKEVALGDIVTVRLKARSTAGTLDNVAITDLLPGGFEMMIDDDSAPQGSNNWQRAEDRISLAVSLTTAEQMFTYRIRAVSAGQFTAPAPEAQGLLQTDRYARGVTTSLTVLRE